MSSAAEATEEDEWQVATRGRRANKSGSASSSNPTPAFKDASKQPVPATSWADRVKSQLDSGSKLLVLLRGLPGSGKTTIARQIQFDGVVYSTDDFFVKRGQYVFDRTKIEEAHTWNRQRTRNAIANSSNPVVIDNTNSQMWEMLPYAQMAVEYSYQLMVIEPDTPWRKRVPELAKRNQHRVPADSIRRMKERFEDNIDVNTLLRAVSMAAIEPTQRQSPAQQPRPGPAASSTPPSSKADTTFNRRFEQVLSIGGESRGRTQVSSNAGGSTA